MRENKAHFVTVTQSNAVQMGSLEHLLLLLFHSISMHIEYKYWCACMECAVILRRRKFTVNAYNYTETVLNFHDPFGRSSTSPKGTQLD